MSDYPSSVPNPEPQPPIPAESKQEGPIASVRHKGWRIQFGILEFHGLLISIGVYYWLFYHFYSAVESRNYGMTVRLPSEKRVVIFLIACLLSFAGTYLSARLATTRGIRSAWRRLILQFGMTFIVIPVLILAFWFIMGVCLMTSFSR